MSGLFRTLWKYYKWDLLIAAVVFVAITWLLGPVEGLFALILVAIMEVTLSGDNAVVNARILAKMSTFWVKMFLTVGLLIAVFGMRFVFPIGIVALTAGLGFGQVIDLALNDPAAYGEKLDAAHPEIAMLGGIFLLMVALNFMFDHTREVHWLKPVERFLARGGKYDAAADCVAGITILTIAFLAPEAERLGVVVAGLISYTTYRGINIFTEICLPDQDDDDDDILSMRDRVKKLTGMAAFGSFMYLEFQDASFSFDGVSGAFAITDNIFVIFGGLLIGASVVRSMTVHLLETGMLAEFRYLEHGAMWAVGGLGLCQIVGVVVHVPEPFTGLIGITFIGLSIWWSRREDKREEEMMKLVTDQPNLVATRD